MSIGEINVTETIKNAKATLEADTELSPSMRTTFSLLITIIELLLQRLGVNSKNSSKPPSQDPNRKKTSKKGSSKKKPGAQKGHKGSTLKMSETPDEIIELSIDRRSLPKGDYVPEKPEKRQVYDIFIKTIVTEFQAEVLRNKKTGERYTAAFPDGVNAVTQYGSSVKAMATYLSQWQLLPYERTCDFFFQNAGIGLSPGSIFNFNKEAYDRLDDFEKIVIHKLIHSDKLHSDETGINVNGKTIWLHSASNDFWALFKPHQKRGKEGPDEIGILPEFKGTLIHDSWSSYFKYECAHALCNAHILRELVSIEENFEYKWAKLMADFLTQLNARVSKLKANRLSKKEYDKVVSQFDQIIEFAEKECPKPEPPPKKKRGRPKQSKARNLLDRLIEHKDSVLMFALVDYIPFTNNMAENDIRMTKVQQKISGCFRSLEGAKIFCRIRSYLLTCQKHGMPAAEALRHLFEGRFPYFIEAERNVR